MADFVVPIVMENLIKILTYEVNLLLGVENEVNILQDDLRFMNAFLEKSEGKRSDGLVKELVDQIRDAAFESEDVIETYAARVVRQRRRNLLVKLFHCIGDASVLHGVGNKTSSIKNRINNICENKAIYDIDIGEAGQSIIDVRAEQLLQRRRRNVEEDDVVGFVNDTTTLVSQLTDPGNLRREVFSIIGMGGLGKTTLARKIYNNTRVKDHFHCCAWINVSQKWQTKSLLLDLLKCFKQITEETSKKTAEDLKDELREQLKGKKYLVVMDDIWSTKVWEEVGAAFPNDKNGSRILITSRERVIALHASPTPPHMLPFLNDDESWELFCKKVFRGEECPTNLETLGRQLAKSCKGLPLSVVLLGGILASKEKSSLIWSRFIGNVNLHLTEGVSILTLSYNHLPRHLKPCFLYLGVFPEDYEMNARELTELWIVEGFIQPIGNMSVMDVAEVYLEQLIDRSLIQVARKRSDGGVKSCRIHDLLRDLCIRESGQDKFLESYSKVNSSSISKSRRLSFQHFSKDSLLYLPCTARSLLLINNSDPMSIPKAFMTNIFICSKFIRVLCLIDANIWKIPSNLDQLVFLRCLWIKDSRIYDLPSSISNLWYLETIHLETYMYKPLPKGIWSVMKNLRTLYVKSDNNFQLSKPSRRLMGECFSNLQVLYWLKVDRNTALVIAKFPNIRKLGLTFSARGGPQLSDGEVENVMTSIGELESLQRFKLRCLPVRYLPYYDNRVCVRLNSLPSTLTNISLAYSIFDWNHFEALARRPHVRVLKLELLSDCKQYRELSVIEGDFPHLEVLKMQNLNILTFRMEKNAMPNLQRLIIRESVYLDNLPDELWSRSTLQLVEVSMVSDELRTMLRDLKMKYSGPCDIIID